MEIKFQTVIFTPSDPISTVFGPVVDTFDQGLEALLAAVVEVPALMIGTVPALVPFNPLVYAELMLDEQLGGATFDALVIMACAARYDDGLSLLSFPTDPEDFVGAKS